MCSSEEYDLSDTPLSALSFKAKELLSSSLNKHKVLPSPRGLPRDYRGLAELVGVSHNDARDPIQGVIVSWSKTDQNPTLQDLLNHLCTIDRFDLVEDILPLLKIDSLNYSLKQKQMKLMVSQPTASLEDNILTYDDADLIKIGLPPGQMYDAYLLYAEQDEHFAHDIVSRLENEFHLKICVKDRDIIGNAGFEHQAITYLISQRCNWLIVVITPNFIDCPAQKFIYNYSVALGLSEGKNKIIPCLFELSDDPMVNKRLREITYSCLPINFARENLFISNWVKLSKTISTPRLITNGVTSKASASAPTIIEITDEEPAIFSLDKCNVGKKGMKLEIKRVSHLAPDRPPRSKGKCSNSPSPSRHKETEDKRKNSKEVSNESCSSTTSKTYLLPEPDKARSNRTSLLTEIKKMKLVKICKNMGKQKKKKVPVALAS